ncbi:MAG: 6-phosphofructokinase [Clostridia bacterium]|nr:6-phosphofructokinase [Clostridia bacterium]
MGKNVLLAQSGGPTAVINSSIVGAFDAAVKSQGVDKVFAAVGGIEGVLNEQLVDLTAIPDEKIRRLRCTPSAGLFSCRHVLPADMEDEEYKRIFEVFEAHNIGYFFYNGGNDSMDTAMKLNKYAKLHGYDVRVNGIPKTIDNDLFGTDHCPGFGSAAKCIATTLQECAHDTFSYPNSKTVIIMETMGRNAGWLAGSASCARYNGKQIADLIYLPEAVFDLDRFLGDINDRLSQQTMVYAVVSEGVRGADGKPYFSSSKNTQDKFGHHQLGGLAAALAEEVKKNIIKRVKTVNLDIAQRCASHIMSKVDHDEAYLAGARSVEFALEGISGVMAAFERKSNDPYTVDVVPLDLTLAANTEKTIPTDWINKEGNNINEKFTEYVTPLIQGEVAIPYSNGLPDYAVIDEPVIEKKLKPYS